MMPNDAQRKALATWGLPAAGSLVLLALPFVPIGIDVLIGAGGVVCAAIAGFKLRDAR